MKYYLSFLLNFFSICVFGQANYPVPKPTFERLFYVQRSINHNTIVYDAVFAKEKELDKKNPIKIYWIS